MKKRNQNFQVMKAVAKTDGVLLVTVLCFLNTRSWTSPDSKPTCSYIHFMCSGLSASKVSPALSCQIEEKEIQSVSQKHARSFTSLKEKRPLLPLNKLS
jgi:hypothetical protein